MTSRVAPADHLPRARFATNACCSEKLVFAGPPQLIALRRRRRAPGAVAGRRERTGRAASAHVRGTVAAKMAGLHVLREYEAPRHVQAPLRGGIGGLPEFELSVQAPPGADREQHVLIAALGRQRQHRPHRAADTNLRALEGVEILGRQPEPRVIGVEPLSVCVVGRRQLGHEENPRVERQLETCAEVVGRPRVERQRRVRVAVPGDIERTRADVGGQLGERAVKLALALGRR